MLRTAFLLASATFFVAGCGPSQPPTRAQAERLCEPEARQADGISGQVGVGISNNGPISGGTVTLNSNIFNPRSERDAFRDCVNRRLGGQPNRSGRGVTAGITLEGGL